MATSDEAANASLQSGGGSVPAQRTIKDLSSTSLAYLKRLFESHATPEGKWTSDQVRVFSQKTQGNTPTPAASDELLNVPDLDLKAFLAYMTSSKSDAILPIKNEDFSWPLASYYISSSHNTYLTGNQLLSDSTTGAYTNVLLRGCRCVEIDVWDGDESDAETSSSESETSDDEAAAKKAARKKQKKENKDKGKSSWGDQLKNKMDKINISKKIEKMEEKATEKVAELEEAVSRKSDSPSTAEPRVLHGHTLTKDISFRDVCVAIRESAFVVSVMPLIVSLEVHCSPKQQIVMVDIMKEVWDGLLVTDPESDIEGLPSPHDLRRKILIKTKHVPAGTPLDKVDTIRSEQVVPAGAQSKPAKTIQELARLAVYTQGVTFKNWTQPEATMPTHMFSISEKKFIEYHEKQWEALFNHNKRYFLRAYPAGFRIGSSNLNPTIFWGGGAQIIALNWQETDEGMMLNEGMFVGTSGYVLKPQGKKLLHCRPLQTFNLRFCLLTNMNSQDTAPRSHPRKMTPPNPAPSFARPYPSHSPSFPPKIFPSHQAQNLPRVSSRTSRSSSTWKAPRIATQRVMGTSMEASTRSAPRRTRAATLISARRNLSLRVFLGWSKSLRL